MATTTKNKRTRSTAKGNGRSSSQKPERYRFAQNVGGEETIAEHEYRSYVDDARNGKTPADPDVLIDVPVVKVDSIHLKLEDLQAHVALKAKILELVNLNVGVDVELGRVELDIKGVEAQALLKVRLDHVAAIVDRVLTTVDRNPELVESIGKAVEHVGGGAGDALGETGQAAESASEGVGDALGDIGQGAGRAVEGAGSGVEDALGNLDQALANAGEQVGQLGSGIAGGAGGADEGALEDVATLLAGDHASRAKVAAKLTVKELGTAAQAKVKGIGEKRRRRKAERYDATEKALDLADELGVDIEEVEGSGADGRITVRDVRDAAREEW